MKHVPGMTAVLAIAGREILRTNPTWKCTDQTRYRPSPESWNTIPDVIDGRIDDGAWMTTAFDDSTWPLAVAINGNQWGKMYPREIPLAREIVLDQLTMLPSGTPINKVLPIELTAGRELLVDFGSMDMAYTSMELESD